MSSMCTYSMYGTIHINMDVRFTNEFDSTQSQFELIKRQFHVLDVRTIQSFFSEGTI